MVLETGRTVTTQGCGYEVAILVVVIGPAEEGDEEVLTLVDAVADDGIVFDTVGVGSGVVVETLPAVTGHNVHIVVAEALVIVGIELEGGVQTAVAVLGVGTAGVALFRRILEHLLGVVPGHF